MEKSKPQQQWKAIRDDVVRLIREVALAKDQIREIDEKHSKATRKLLLDMVAVLDTFDSVFESISAKEDAADPQTKTWLSHFRGIRKQLERQLRLHGVRAIPAVGAQLSLAHHAVAEVRRDPSLADDTIAAELQRGYLWNGAVLRTAQVAVVKNK